MAVKGKEVLGDAAAGAAVGSVAGPWGTAIGAGAGALYGLFSGALSSEDEDVAAAQAAKIEALRKAGVDIQAYRPELMRMEQAGKQEQLGQFGATDSMLAAMQGQQAPGQANQMPVRGEVGLSPMALKNAPPQGPRDPRIPSYPREPASAPVSPLNLRRR